MKRLASLALLLCTARLGLADTKTITVSPDGPADCKTLQEAIAAIPDRSPDRTIIHIKPGTYHGQMILPATKINVTFQGDLAEKTILTYAWNQNERDPAITGVNRYPGTGVVILGADFRAENVTFENTSGNHGQAQALRIDAERSILKNCRLLGWQDTLLLNSGRQYLDHCYIEGRVDFIYGAAAAVFDHCEIRSKNGGHITAASTPQNQPFGFVFFDCKLTGDPAPWIDPNATQPALTSAPATAPAPAVAKPVMTDLGRPWRPYASVTFINCELGDHIKPDGWSIWVGNQNHLTARYAEYNSTGPGANPGKRLDWTKQLTKEQADKITIDAVLGGTDRWNPKAPTTSAPAITAAQPATRPN